MSEYNYVCAATEKVADAWFNTDLTRFAVVPGAWEVDEDEASPEVEVETLVEAFLSERSADGRVAILMELLEMHGRGQLLWPVSAFFGFSCLGDVEASVLFDAIADIDVNFALTRAWFEESEHMPKVDRTNKAFLAWKVIASIRYAWAGVLRDPDDYRPDHLEAFSNVLRVDGRIRGEIPAWMRTGLRITSDYFQGTTGDEQFGMLGRKRYKPPKKRPRLENVFDREAHLKWADDEFERWMDERLILTKKPYRQAKRLLGEFLATLPASVGSQPEKAFPRDHVIAFLAFAKGWSTPASRLYAVGKVFEFLQWLSHESRDSAGKARIEVAFFEADVKKFNDQIDARPRSRGAEVVARPMPMRFHMMLKEIITEDDFAWPKSLRDRSDKQLIHWIRARNPETGENELVFCPVIPRILLLQLDLPIRNIQARRLESSEGDDRAWDPDTSAWGPNPSPHAGYWARAGAKNRRRGVIREIATADGSTITGLWINSNKTQDRGNLFDETSGYEIPWEHEDVLRNLAEMRRWQEVYNPVDGPLAHADVPAGIFQEEPSEAVRALIPDRFYLFRHPANPGPRGREAPPSYPNVLRFFNEALEELERRLNEEDPDRPVRIIVGRDGSGGPKQAIFTMHGMRSATLTGLHLAGVPIEILSKLVAGHASILMTLKYTKFDPLHVSEILTAARVKAMADAAGEFPRFLEKATFEEAVRMTARLADDGISQMKGPYDEPSAWSRMDIGICPNGGTLCRVGGEAILRRTDKGLDKSAYAPVPGGPRNCVRCRFFVTGLPFLVPLWTHSAAIAAKADAVARAAAEKEAAVGSLKAERRRLTAAKQAIPETLRQEIVVTEEAWLADVEERDRILADLHAAMALIEKIRQIASARPAVEGDGAPMSLIVAQDEVPEVVGRESTRFEVADAVVQASRIFPSLRSAELERERDAFLDKILYHNDYVPITLAPLSPSERQKAADALSALLLIELGAREAERLASGATTLADLGLQDRFEDACRRAIGSPMARVGARRIAIGPLIEADPAG